MEMELELGVQALAAPVFDADEKVVASVCAVFSSERCTEEFDKEVKAATLEAVIRRIS